MRISDWSSDVCSSDLMADHSDGMTAHLAHRDVTLVAVSRAPLPDIECFRQRMGWQFKWVSSHGSDFNYDFGVSFTPEDLAKGEIRYNYGSRSEEHTSELQSLMRISYAVFCSKKKITCHPRTPSHGPIPAHTSHRDYSPLHTQCTSNSPNIPIKIPTSHQALITSLSTLTHVIHTQPHNSPKLRIKLHNQ